MTMCNDNEHEHDYHQLTVRKRHFVLYCSKCGKTAAIPLTHVDGLIGLPGGWRREDLPDRETVLRVCRSYARTLPAAIQRCDFESVVCILACSDESWTVAQLVGIAADEMPEFVAARGEALRWLRFVDRAVVERMLAADAASVVETVVTLLRHGCEPGTLENVVRAIDRLLARADVECLVVPDALRAARAEAVARIEECSGR
jgi:hypothetical protein